MIDRALVEWVTEAMAPIGRVTTRPMMGGAALYCDGLIFAIHAEGELWLKSDSDGAAAWEAAGCPPFRYTRKDGRAVTTGYRRAPDAVHDDGDALRHWAQRALAASRRVAEGRPRRSSR